MTGFEALVDTERQHTTPANVFGDLVFTLGEGGMTRSALPKGTTRK